MVHTKALEVINVIDEVSSSLCFVREYFEANHIELEHLPIGVTVSVLNGATTRLNEASDRMIDISESIETYSMVGTSFTASSTDANKIIDMYLANIDAKNSLVSTMENKAQIQLLMRKNQKERRKRASNSEIAKIVDIK